MNTDVQIQLLEEELIGKMVIVRSNEDELYQVGTLISVNEYSLPVVEIDNKQYMCGGIVVPWSKELGDLLVEMNPTQQWNFLKEIVQMVRGLYKLQQLKDKK